MWDSARARIMLYIKQYNIIVACKCLKYITCILHTKILHWSVKLVLSHYTTIICFSYFSYCSSLKIVGTLLIHEKESSLKRTYLLEYVAWRVITINLIHRQWRGMTANKSHLFSCDADNLGTHPTTKKTFSQYALLKYQWLICNKTSNIVKLNPSYLAKLKVLHIS